MNKVEIKNHLENYQQNLIDKIKGEFNRKKDASEIDHNDVRDADSHSHQSQSQEDEQLIDDRLKNALDALTFLKNTPLKESNKVELGSLIETDSFLIYVGIATQKFTKNGKEIIGISTDAPIYNKLEGQTVGFPFEITGVSCKIVSIK